MQIDVDTGQRIFEEAYEHAWIEPLRPERPEIEASLSFDEAGDVAWVIQTECNRIPCPESVIVHDRHGTSTVASYEQPSYVFSETGPPPSEVWDLTLGPGHLYWSYGPTEQSQRFEAPLP